MGDEAIVALYWARSEEAIRFSEQKYGGYCGRIAGNILMNREDSEECVSDTWLRAWNAIPPQRPEFLRAFFGRITRNLALNLLEKRHAEKRGGAAGQYAEALDELAEIIADERPVDAEERIVLHQVMERFLAELKAEDRKIFVRRYWYFSAVREIAEQFGVGESKVKMTLLRARERLRAMLTEEGIVL